MNADENPSANPHRRQFLVGLGMAGLGGAGSACAQRPARSGGEAARAVAAVAAVAPHGATQAGVVRPARPQPHLELMVLDVTDRNGAPELLAELGRRVTALTAGSDPRLAGLAPGDLTVTVGVGPALAAATLPEGLPRFAREEVPERHRGGDLLVQICASDPLVTSLAGESLRTWLSGAARPRWRQSGFRGPQDGPAGRNLLGFLDGIVGPSTEAELREEVWLDEPAGGTIAVVRRIRLDVTRFLALPVAEQERIIGRRRKDGAPLSGGAAAALADLHAKSPDGQWLIPADAHVRRAHALPIGAGLMLRRSYSYDNGPDDRGLVFISFQKALRTFTATQHRLDESDRLMRFATVTATGVFLVLPGFRSDTSLGAGVSIRQA